MEIVLSLGNQYLSEFRKDNSKPERFPLDFVICKHCNQAQLGESVPLKILYTDNYGYRSGVNSTMREHLSDLASTALSLVEMNDRDYIIDIGSNDGTLLKFFPSKFNRVGFDLISKFAVDYAGSDIAFWNTAMTKMKQKAKIITAISMFYDIEDWQVAYIENMVTLPQ
jgi:hypothetical protein